MIRNTETIASVERSRTTRSNTLIELCDAGRYGEAWELAREAAACPEKSLIEGAALMLDFPEQAKDPLSNAARLLTGEMSERASIWLSSCYWSIGEKSEARATLEAVVPTAAITRFSKGLLASIIESEDMSEATRLLDSIEGLADSMPPLLRGKFFNQRGYLRRRSGNSDSAIIAYEEARYWYERVADKRYLGGVANNLAFIYLDLQDLASAHDCADVAIASFRKTGQVLYLGQAYDTKAQIYLREQRFDRAHDLSSLAITVLGETDHKEALTRALINQALALSATDRCIEALTRLHRAQSLAEVVGSGDLRFDVAQTKVTIAEKLLQACEIDRINVTLETSGGSFRVAAEKLGTTHPRIKRWIKKYNLNWNGNKPRRSIIKPAK